MCNDTETEIADTMKNSIELMCVKEGIFSPNLLNISTGQWDANYTCQIPKGPVHLIRPPSKTPFKAPL